MELDLVEVQERFNRIIGDREVSAGDRYVVYMATITELEGLTDALKRDAALILKHAARAVNEADRLRAESARLQGVVDDLAGEMRDLAASLRDRGLYFSAATLENAF